MDVASAQYTRASRPQRIDWWGLWMLLVVTSMSCVVPAPEAVEVASPTTVLQIHEDKVTPAAVSAVVVTSDESVEFSVVGAVTAQNTRQPLNYYWFYDYDETQNLLGPYVVCNFARERCRIQVCKMANALDKPHWLRVVVADQQILADATSPFQFPAGTNFDSLLWQISVTGSCN